MEQGTESVEIPAEYTNFEGNGVPHHPPGRTKVVVIGLGMVGIAFM